MKRQVLLCLVLVYFSACVKSQTSVKEIMKYPWIPKKVNWREGSFETFYFYIDSNFVKIASTQTLTDNDSISFMSEPGFILYSGKYSIAKGKNEILLDYRLLYRTFKLTDENLPSDYMSEKILFSTTGGNKMIKAKGVSYIKTKKFTNESLHKLKNVIEKFLPSVSN
jgi:hypothetical protein